MMPRPTRDAIINMSAWDLFFILKKPKKRTPTWIMAENRARRYMK